MTNTFGLIVLFLNSLWRLLKQGRAVGVRDWTSEVAAHPDLVSADS